MIMISTKQISHNHMIMIITKQIPHITIQHHDDDDPQENRDRMKKRFLCAPAQDFQQ